MPTCDTNSLLADAACFSCLPHGFFLPLKLALLSQILQQKSGQPAPSVDELLADAQCFACLSQGELQLIKLQLLCSILGGNTFYSGSIPSSPTTSVSDPIILPPYARGNPYELAIFYDASVGSYLMWSVPFDLDSAVFGTAQFPDPIPIVGIWLQRSTTSTSTHGEPDFVYEVIDDGPPADTDWQTLYGWGSFANIQLADVAMIGANLPLPITPPPGQSFILGWIDQVIPPNNSYISYRLSMKVGPIPDGIYAGKKFEIDWNIVMVVAPYDFSAVRGQDPNNPSQQITTLTWSNPVF